MLPTHIPKKKKKKKMKEKEKKEKEKKGGSNRASKGEVLKCIWFLPHRESSFKNETVL